MKRVDWVPLEYYNLCRNNFKSVVKNITKSNNNIF